MKEKYSYLSKNVLLFSISGFVPKLLSLILVPIYTSCLTTAEYGISDMISNTVTLLIPIFTLGIQDAVLRFALDEEYEPSDVFSVAMKIILVGILLVLLGTVIICFFDIPTMKNGYLLFFFIMYITNAINSSASLFCRAIDKVQVIVVSSILNSVTMLLSNILFLVVFKWGLIGYLAANSVGATVSLTHNFIAGKLYKYIKITTNKELRRKMIEFSFPLIFSVISWWANSASSRYILAGLEGLSASGIFAVAYKIPHLLTTFQNVFAQAWSISAIKEFDKNDKDGFVGNTYNLMNFAMTIICSGIMVVNIFVAKLLYANEFFEAWKYVPPLLVSVLFNAMSLFIGSIFTAVKDTKTLSISTIIGALVNVVCNIIFVYLWGIYGAAFATMIGYFVVLLIRHIILRKHIFMRINWTKDLMTYGVLILQMIIAMLGIKFIFIQCIMFILICVLHKKELVSVLETIKSVILKKNK